MGTMQEKLCKLLKAQCGVTEHATTSDFPHLDGLDSTFQDLGGDNLDGWPTSWKIDMKLEDGTFLELDEYLHFNRYRLLTLESQLYKTLPAFPLQAYKDYCTRHEPQCYKAGRSPKGKW